MTRISSITPKSVKLLYTLTVLKNDSTEYDECIECKNLTEGKRLFKSYVNKLTSDNLISLLATVSRIYKNNTFSSDLVLCKSIGRNNG